MNVNGSSAKSLFFGIPGMAYLNTGSFGALPKEVAEVKKEIQDEIEKDPDHWFRHILQRRLHQAADLIADLYKAPRDQVTLVENATSGVATVLISLDLGKNDEVLITSFSYGTVKMQCQELSERRGVSVRVLDIAFPFSHDSIVDQYEQEFQNMTTEGRRIAVIDHITSQGALLMPLERILQSCERHGIFSVVDGAHGPGQLRPDEMDLSRLRPTFYTANLHKWAFVPRSCAFLFVSQPFLDVIRPPIVSWLHGESFRQRFTFRGTFDTTAIACIPAAFQFTDKLGGINTVREYVTPLIRRGVRLVIDRLGGEPLCSEEYSAPFMMAFYLGKAFDEKIDVVKALTGKNIFQETMHVFLRKRGIICPVIGFRNDRCLIRVSAHVFTEIEDFIQLADGLEEIGKQLQEITIEDAVKLQEWDWTSGKPL